MSVILNGVTGLQAQEQWREAIEAIEVSQGLRILFFYPIRSNRTPHARTEAVGTNQMRHVA